MTRGAKKHSVFVERLMFKVTATDALGDEAGQIREFVAWLSEKQKLGVIREAVISALHEKFKREAGYSASYPATETAFAGEDGLVKPQQASAVTDHNPVVVEVLAPSVTSVESHSRTQVGNEPELSSEQAVIQLDNSVEVSATPFKGAYNVMG